MADLGGVVVKLSAAVLKPFGQWPPEVKRGGARVKPMQPQEKGQGEQAQIAVNIAAPADLLRAQRVDQTIAAHDDHQIRQTLMLTLPPGGRVHMGMQDEMAQLMGQRPAKALRCLRRGS